MANDWREIELGEIASIIGGGTPSSKIDDYWEGDIPWITPKDLSNHPYKLISRGSRNITQLGLEKSSAKLMPAGTLLISSRAPIGYTAIAKNELCTSQGFKSLILKDGYSSDFFYYLIKGNVSKLEAVSSGSTFKEISGSTLKKISFKLPPLPEQKAIAHILGSLDNKIELNRQMNETLEAMAQALFKSWFVDFDLVIDNALAAGNAIPDEFQQRALQRTEQRKAIEKKDNSDIQGLFPDAFEFTEEMGWIPKGWAVSNVGTEFDVTMGQSPPGSTYNEIEEGIYFFQGSTDFGFRYPTPRIYCTEPKRLANKRDTLVSVRAPVGDTNLAAVDCCIGRGLAALRHKSGSASFTYYAMLQLKENFKIYEGEGTVFGSINQKDFKNLIQLKSPEVLISEFEINAGALDSKIELNSLNIITLAKLRDTLLPKLMSGELRLDDVEILDEL